MGQDDFRDSSDEEKDYERQRKESVDALVHQTAFKLSEAYSRARALGCFDKEC